MNQLKILNNREIKGILNLLNNQFGFKEKFDYVFLMSSKNKIYLVNKDIGNIDLERLRIDAIGLYFGELNHGELRLSIEGSQMIGKKSNKNIIELDKKESELWSMGNDIDKKMDVSGFVILKHKKDFIGCGRYKEGKIFNYVPKERRLRVVSS
ncbi:hypothetical protein KY313_01530 [Candidatus Woesearchaeota archaeon]|jgi:NOL1/NOP2/fmu family ribosome biogenesis protein|nr:hypothetical protein [Candidatus Woesearchaeota archaeon]